MEAIWRSNQIAVVKPEPQYPIEQIVEAIKDLYESQGVYLNHKSVSYFDGYVAFVFDSQTYMYSLQGSQAQQFARVELTKRLNRRVELGGGGYDVKVWVYE